MPSLGLGLGLQPVVMAGGAPAAFQPTNIADCVEWFRADLGITLNGADVAAWANQGTAGAARDIAQGVPADQPLFSAAGGPLGTPMVEFDGVSEYLRGIWVQAQPTQVFSVVFPSVSTTSPMTVWDGGPGNSRRAFTNGVATLAGFAGAQLQAGGLTIAAWQRAEIEYNGAAGSVRRNDLAPITGNIGANASNGLTLAAFGTIVQFADCRIAEWIEYSRILTGAEETEIRAYLTARYGI
jgi:hypothetical protein